MSEDACFPKVRKIPGQLQRGTEKQQSDPGHSTSDSIIQMFTHLHLHESQAGGASALLCICLLADQLLQGCCHTDSALTSTYEWFTLPRTCHFCFRVTVQREEPSPSKRPPSWGKPPPTHSAFCSAPVPKAYHTLHWRQAFLIRCAASLLFF